MAKKETAENKLLKIIESQGEKTGAEEQAPAESTASQGQEAAQEVAKAVKGTGLPTVSPPPFLTSFLDIFKGKIPQTASGLSLGLKEANNILSIMALIVFIVLLANFFKDMKSVKKQVLLTVDVGLTKGVESTLFPVRELQEYLDNLSRRNIFQPFEKKAQEQAMTVELETKRIESLVKNFKLVGISWLDSPETASVMIENTENGNIYFLKEGEQVNKVTVKTIYADRVVFSYEGEELTMKL